MCILLDDGRGDAPPGTMAVLHPSRSFRWGGMVGALMSGSGHAGRLLKLRETAKAAARQLAAAVAEIVAALP